MDPITIQIVSVVAIIGFLWSLHREIGSLRKDMADLHKEMTTEVASLRDRMGQVEGLLHGLIARPSEPQV